MIKVLLTDDHQMFTDGIKAFLEAEEDIEILGQAKNGKEVISFLEQNHVDVVVLDIRMPEMDGIETTKYIRNNNIDTKILILSMHNDKQYIFELMRAGVNGYVLKEKSKKELLMAIRNVYRGQAHFGLEVLNMATMYKPEVSPKVELTPREIDVLCLIAEGLTTKEISEKIFRSEPTVNTHRRNLLKKLKVSNEKHLVRYAIKHGYVKL